MSGGSRTSSDRNNNNDDDSNVAASFGSFFRGWFVRQEIVLGELLSAQENSDQSRDDEDLKDLITRVLGHYQQYYEEKSKIGQRNVFLLFSPPWFTPFERTFFWVTGFRPTLAFRLVSHSVNDFTEDQRQRMTALMGETKIEEKLLNDELARIQESVAAPPMMELARRWDRLLDGEEMEEEQAMANLQSSLEAVVASADLLRMTTAGKVVEILSPAQNVKFLTAATQLQCRVRSWGLQREMGREES